MNVLSKTTAPHDDDSLSCLLITIKILEMQYCHVKLFLFFGCKGKLCGSAGDIQSGQFVYTGEEFGDTATAVCDEG